MRSISLVRLSAVATVTVIFFLAAISYAATTHTQWTVESPTTPADLTNSATSPPVSASTGSGTLTGVHASALTDWSTPVGNGSAESLSSNEWAIGDYYQFQTSTTGVSGVTLSWGQTRSSTGPSGFDLRWSSDGVNYTTAMSYIVPQIAWSSAPASFQPGSVFTADLSAVAALNNQANAYFRLVATSAPSASGGTNRVDDFTVMIPGSVPDVLVPPGDFRGKSHDDWGFDYQQWGIKTGPGGQSLPDTFDGVRYLPPNLGSSFVANLTIQHGTPLLFSPFNVFGERYDNGTEDNPNDPVIEQIFNSTTIETRFDGEVVLQGGANSFPDRKFGVTMFPAPIPYTTPQPRGPGVNAVSAIFGVGLTAIFDGLPLGQHTIVNVYNSPFFGGTFTSTYNITVVPEPTIFVLLGWGVVACIVGVRCRPTK